MSRFNTGNPLGSNDPRDLDDNAKNMDLAVNSEEAQWLDRFGRPRLPLMEQERQFVATQERHEDEFQSAQESRSDRFNDFIASSGYQFAGDYGPGIEITEYNQLIRDSNGEFWRVSGQIELPYVTTGAGIPEDDALVPAGDAVLRQDLANPDKGAAMVARGVVAVDSIKDLANISPSLRRGDLRFEVDGFFSGSVVGGGSFKWDSGSDKSKHDGGIVLDPERIAEWDGTPEDLPTLFSTGAGTGCFIRTNCSTISPDMFGGSLNQIVDSGAYQSHRVFVDTETTVSKPMELVNRGLDFGRRHGRITFSGVHNPDGAAITLTRNSNTERNHLDGMYALIPADNDVQNMIHINNPSTTIDWLRIDGYGCPGGIVKIENSWGTTLRDVGIYVGGLGPGIVLEGSNGGVSLVNFYIVPYRGKGIVVNGTGRSILIEGILDGSSPFNDIGLEINGGDVLVNSYFENQRAVVNGGRRVYFGPRTTSTAPHRMYEINGGDLVIFDGIRIEVGETSAPTRIGIDVESGMGGKVIINENCKISHNSKIRSKSYIEGYYAGENLLTDPYFSNWTDGTFNSYPITFLNTYNNSLYRYEKDTTHVQSGKYSLTVYRDGDPSHTGTITQGVDINVSDVLTKVPGDGKVTFGAWVRMEDVEGFAPGDARVVFQLRADGVALPQDLPGGLTSTRLLLGDGFVFLNGHYTIPEGTTSLVIRVFGALNAQETSSFTIDRMGIVAGFAPINVPFKM